MGAGYHLATITSREEQRTLQKLLRGLRGEFWIGGYQDGSDKWHWVTDERWRYTNWAKGEPNDYYGHDSEQHLAIWKWNDEGNKGNISGFIVERGIKPHNGNDVVTPIPGAAWLMGSGMAVLAGLRYAKRRRTLA